MKTISYLSFENKLLSISRFQPLRGKPTKELERHKIWKELKKGRNALAIKSPLEEFLEEVVDSSPWLRLSDIYKGINITEEDILEERLKQTGEQQIIPIQFLESKKLQLKQPIVVNLTYSSGTNLWIVDCPELNLYGEGEDENQAIKDLKIVLEEFYFSLKKDKEKLGPELKHKWDILKQIIQEK